MRFPQNLLRVYNMLMKTPSSSSWHLLYNFSIEKISRMVWNNFMMHLCTVATLCFFKITSPRNYYYCDQDDFPWVCGSKYVSKSNCCHRHLVLYISDVKKFPYLPKIYISAIRKHENWNWIIFFLCVDLHHHDRHILRWEKRVRVPSWPPSTPRLLWIGSSQVSRFFTNFLLFYLNI